METVFELVEALSRGRGSRRTGQPVRRDSRLKGGEGRFWQPFNGRNARRYLLAAERYDCAGRMAARRDRTGRKIGPLGHVGLNVLRELLRLVDYRTGRLDPALTTLAARTGHSVAGVVAALKRLRQHGFTDWLRRVEPTGNEGRGPRVRQASNAYALLLPKRAEALLPAAPPEPVDHEHARAAKAAEWRAMIDSLPVGQRNQAELGQGGFGAVLDRFMLTGEQAARERLAQARQSMGQNAIQSRSENPTSSNL